MNDNVYLLISIDYDKFTSSSKKKNFYHEYEINLATAPPFTVPCEGREDWFLHRSHQIKP